ncbi:hypothetical protein GWN42_19360 [candidate division KSB1 bacterium]|nr:hypothetical protein [candidate division KSB1 bacterium]
MSRFKQITYPKESPELVALYKEMVANGLGTDVPINWFTSQSERPDILEASWSLTKGILLHGKLPPTLKQMIAMKVSKQNQCQYCTTMHTRALQAMGVPTEVIDNVTTDINLKKVPPPQRAIITFALKAAYDPKSVTDADLRSLQENGLSAGEIMEVVMMAAYSNFINFWADVSGIRVEDEEKP